MLSALRARLYTYTRPTFALVGGAAALAFDTRAPPAPAKSSSSTPGLVANVTALPMLAVGGAGVVAVLRRHGRLSWLSHPYEFWAWGTAYAGLSVAGGAALLGMGQDVTLLAPAAGAVLAATAGERLGSAVGRALLPTLATVGIVSAGAALRGDPHGARAVQALHVSALVLLPVLQLSCLPVYTLSVQGAFAWAWVLLAAGATALESAPPLAPSPDATRQMLLAVGGASFLRTLLTRAPICHF